MGSSRPTAVAGGAQRRRISAAPKPPLCKGRCRGRQAVTEGLAGRGYEFSIAHYRGLELQPLSQLALTAPLAQGSLGAGRNWRIVLVWALGRNRFSAIGQILRLRFAPLRMTGCLISRTAIGWAGDREGRPYGCVPFNEPFRKIRPYNPPVGFADSPLCTRGPLLARTAIGAAFSCLPRLLFPLPCAMIIPLQKPEDRPCSMFLPACWPLW